MAKSLKLLAVGRLKSGFWKQAADHYRERIGKYHSLLETEVRDAPGNLSPEDRAEREAADLRRKTGPQDILICLDQDGRSLTSEQFADRLRRWHEDPGTPCFILGGAFGIDRELLRSADFRLSLSSMTLPHEMSRILLLEQIYRAATINWGHPYHH